MAKLEKAICETCSKEFSYYRSTLRGKDARFCSRKCIKYQAWNKGKIKYSSCQNCGKQVRAWRKYCSSKCFQEKVDYSSFLPKSMSGENNPCWTGGKPKCVDCGKKLSTYKSVRCSKCNGIYLSGSNSPKWRGGVTEVDRLDRVKFRKKIQKKVFERDDYTCQMCGEKWCALQVDHIQPWAEYVELRFDINNCRTLCMACHYKITFGKDMPKGVTTWGHNLSQIGGY